MTFRFIKGGSHSGGILGARGYALADYLEAGGRSLCFKLFPPLGCDYSIVFGFRGVGNHFRLDYRNREKRFVISRICDGNTIYLQHAILDPGDAQFLVIEADDISLRIHCGDLCFINLFQEGCVDGRYGYAGVGRETLPPALSATAMERKNPEWIVLGDGYSNNRWKNRDFYSWPELAFGDKAEYLNACVAAGNTRRVIEIVNTIAKRFSGTRVIVAVGADDVIEGDSVQEISERLRHIITRIQELGAAEVHLATIVPQIKHSDGTMALNRQILDGLSGACDSIIDFHQLLGGDLEAWAANGDFPGATFQRKIAIHVLERFYGHGRLAPLDDPIPHRQLRGLPARVVARLGTWIDASLGRF